MDPSITHSIAQAQKILASEPTMTNACVDRLEQQMANFGGLMVERLVKQLEETNAKLDSFATKHSGGGENSGSCFQGGRDHNGSSNSVIPKLAKLDFSKYNGLGNPTNCGYIRWNNSLNSNKLMSRNNYPWLHTIWKGRPKCGNSSSRTVKVFTPGML